MQIDLDIVTFIVCLGRKTAMKPAVKLTQSIPQRQHLFVGQPPALACFPVCCRVVFDTGSISGKSIQSNEFFYQGEGCYLFLFI